MSEYRQHPDNPLRVQYRTGARRKWRDAKDVFLNLAFAKAWVAMMNQRERKDQ